LGIFGLSEIVADALMSLNPMKTLKLNLGVFCGCFSLNCFGPKGMDTQQDELQNWHEEHASK
jgi:hypothetical protein